MTSGKQYKKVLKENCFSWFRCLDDAKLNEMIEEIKTFYYGEKKLYNAKSAVKVTDTQRLITQNFIRLSSDTRLTNNIRRYYRSDLQRRRSSRILRNSRRRCAQKIADDARLRLHFLVFGRIE